MADKEPAPGTHEQFVKPLWKQGVGSTVHCVAGDAAGIVLAAAGTALLGFPMLKGRESIGSLKHPVVGMTR